MKMQFTTIEGNANVSFIIGVLTQVTPFFLNINFHAFTIVKSWISGQLLCPIATYQPNNFSSLADNFKVFEAFEDEGDVERKYRNQIDHVHWLSHEPDKYYSQYFVKKKKHWIVHLLLFGQMMSLMANSKVKKITTKLSRSSMTKTTQGNSTFPDSSYKYVKDNPFWKPTNY